MAKHEAVDRLMALAMEKRADRIPGGVPGASRVPEEIEILDPISGPEIGGAKGRDEQATAASRNLGATGAGTLLPGVPASASVAGRGRQLLHAIRPLLPAVAGAMRLIDHGAVQAVARLLPLLSGGAGLAGSLPEQAAVSAAHQESTRALEASSQTLRQDVDALTQRLDATQDLLGRTRTQLERVAAELAGKESESRALADRVRLLSAGLIILLMLIIAQMILLVVMLHK